MLKFTVLGGSSIAIPELIAALLPRIHDGRQLHVVLHGRDADKLALVGGIAARMTLGTPGLTIETTTQLEAALTGADYVLNQVRVGGFAARAYDETFPHRWDIPGEETVGPGGAANALRSVPIVLDLCRVIERVAPQATLLTFSNPSSVVQRAIVQTTSLNVIGLCDAPYSMVSAVACSLGVEREAVDTQYVGMHHFGWITSAVVNGQERLPDVLADDAACTALGLDPAIGRATGTLPHTYLRYFFHPDRLLKKQRHAVQPRARELQALEAELLDAYRHFDGDGKPDATTRRSAVWYGAVVVPVLAGLAFGDPARLAINVVNGDRIAALPPDTIVELSGQIEDGVMSTPKPRCLPPPSMIGLLQANAAYEATLVDAILSDSADLLLQAFLLNPLVPSYDVARELIDELWPRRGWPEGMML